MKKYINSHIDKKISPAYIGLPELQRTYVCIVILSNFRIASQSISKVS